MNQKEITENLRKCARKLQRGMFTVYECEKAMDEAIMNGVLEMPNETAQQNDMRIAAVRKLKRKMWRMLLEATKGARYIEG